MALKSWFYYVPNIQHCTIIALFPKQKCWVNFLWILYEERNFWDYIRIKRVMKETKQHVFNECFILFHLFSNFQPNLYPQGFFSLDVKTVTSRETNPWRRHFALAPALFFSFFFSWGLHIKFEVYILRTGQRKLKKTKLVGGAFRILQSLSSLHCGFVFAVFTNWKNSLPLFYQFFIFCSIILSTLTTDVFFAMYACIIRKFNMACAAQLHAHKCCSMKSIP